MNICRKHHNQCNDISNLKAQAMEYNKNCSLTKPPLFNGEDYAYRKIIIMKLFIEENCIDL